MKKGFSGEEELGEGSGERGGRGVDVGKDDIFLGKERVAGMWVWERFFLGKGVAEVWVWRKVFPEEGRW